MSEKGSKNGKGLVDPSGQPMAPKTKPVRHFQCLTNDTHHVSAQVFPTINMAVAGSIQEIPLKAIACPSCIMKWLGKTFAMMEVATEDDLKVNSKKESNDNS